MNRRARKRSTRTTSSADPWRFALDVVPDPIMILSPEYRILQVNEATASFLSMPAGQICGQFCYQLFHGTARCPEFCPSIQARESRRRAEAELYFDRRQQWLQIIVDPVLDSSGNLTGLVHTARDMTNIRRSERELQLLRGALAHAGRVSTVGQLTSTIAHELNQPLGAILSNTAAAELFLRNNPPALDELWLILSEIRNDTQRASEVIRRMRLLLTKNEQERLPLHLSHLIHEALALLRGEMAENAVRVVVEVAPDLPMVSGDKVQLQQVLLNLIVNALDAMRETASQRRLNVRARVSAPGELVVEVEDTGPGIRSQAFPRVFEPFYSTKPGGLGLGLPICRSLVEAHGGRIEAENNPNRGATFRFVLPAQKEPECSCL